jgi:hypothetical protein
MVDALTGVAACLGLREQALAVWVGGADDQIDLQPGQRRVGQGF